MQLIQTISLTGSQSSIEFSSIPQTYTDLVLVVSVITAQTNPDLAWLRLAFNGSNSNFSNRKLYGDGSGVGSDTSADFMPQGFNGNPGNGLIYIPNYTSSNNKSFSIDSVQEANATKAYQMLLAGLWSNTSAITSIAFNNPYGNLNAGSSASLYGITKA